jgi:predicted transcriptional regulator YdeE
MISKIETSSEPAFSIVGIAVRTTNENNQAQSDMGQLWGKFMENHLQGKITDRLSDDLFAVYMNYETDHTGYYTALLGCKCDPLSLVPDSFEQVDIPEGQYQIYSLSGEIPIIVGEAWAEIWESGTPRAYTFDYDRYNNSCQPPEVKVYVAV